MAQEIDLLEEPLHADAQAVVVVTAGARVLLHARRGARSTDRPTDKA